MIGLTYPAGDEVDDVGFEVDDVVPEDAGPEVGPIGVETGVEAGVVGVDELEIPIFV